MIFYTVENPKASDRNFLYSRKMCTTYFVERIIFAFAVSTLAINIPT